MDGSLFGLTVIDASRVLAGPLCGQTLGDYGACVIKVEGPAGDETRSFGAPVVRGSAPYFEALNRNKRAITVDMNVPAAQKVFWSLVEGADILIENFKASTLRAWGVDDPKEIVRQYPRLIHCRITGFGDDGPLGGLPGYDAAVQAISGLMSVNGNSNSGPIRLGVPVVDLATSMQATIAILAAVQERNRSGHGQLCDVSLYDCALAFTHPHFPNYLWTEQEPLLTGNSHPNIAPYSTFDSLTQPIFIAVGNGRQFVALTRLLECRNLAQDSRFQNNVDRVRNREALEKILSEHIRQHNGLELVDRLLAAGVPCAPIQTLSDVVNAPHTRHRKMILDQDEYRGTGFPVKLSRTPATLRHIPPEQGQHTRQVLINAGYGDDLITELEETGALGSISNLE